ncbi:hypothetical protein SUGI_0773380 [Cryptomeria japonica]|nr:hypothetical protein SUGI_0773380 [Cryptomeria japonica]
MSPATASTIVSSTMVMSPVVASTTVSSTAAVAQAVLTFAAGDITTPLLVSYSTTVGLKTSANTQTVAVDSSATRADFAIQIGGGATGLASRSGGLSRGLKARPQQGLLRQNVDRGFNPVSNAISIKLKAETKEEIDYNVSIFSTHGVICRFRGFWPSLP